ncbi:hypothetical protein QYZ40_24305 [Vibrio parahaemolyticus]|nr:hypothetical protein [Vibrio parahaemolyticus]
MGFFFSKEEDQESWIEIGKVQYSDLNVSKVSVPKEAGSTYDLNFSEQQPVQGMHIPSHRPVFNYKEVESIPTKPKKKKITLMSIMLTLSINSPTRLNGLKI